MRGRSACQRAMLFGVTPDQLVPADHPIRRIKPIVEQALAHLSPTFAQMYAEGGRPSIPPEHLLKASLLIALYSVRGERQFCERLQYDLLFKWFLGLNITDPAFDASTFSKDRARLIQHDVAAAFFDAVLDGARARNLLSDEHFTVDGTLVESWASMKSFRPKQPVEADEWPSLRRWPPDARRVERPAVRTSLPEAQKRGATASHPYSATGLSPWSARLSLQDALFSAAC